MIKKQMEYNINSPWLSLDDWQKEYIETAPEIDCHLLTPRQAGKTTAMSIKAVELCVHHFGEGEVVLISSLTERQAILMLKKAQIYAEAMYPSLICRDKDNKPTMHRLMFKCGKIKKGILCYAAGEEGDSTRGYTIKKLMCDEGARMKEEYFISALPTLSITKGSMDIASTPCGKTTKHGEENFFYKCWKDESFKKFAVNLENVPRYDKKFLEKMRKRMTKLQYAQEYEGIFTDELKRLFDEEMIEKICKGKRNKNWIRSQGNKYYLGVDVAGLGDDECTYEIFEKDKNKFLRQIENIVEKRNYTTDTSRKIIELDRIYNHKSIGIDDGGVGFGVFSELLRDPKTKRKTIALNNASRDVDNEGNKSKKLLKEEMYFNLQILMENGAIELLDDDEIKASLASIQHDEGRIYGAYSHITEGIIRAVWMATKDKDLNIFVHGF